MDRDKNAGFRIPRLEISIREELELLLRDDVSDPDLEGVRVQAVVLSPDYRNARVHVLGPHGRSRETVLRGLNRAAPFLRRRLGDAIELKRNPDLRFVYEAELEAE